MGGGPTRHRRGCVRRGPPAHQPAPITAGFQDRPFLEDGQQHPGIEEDVDGEETFVGAEALRVADERPRLIRFLAEPDLLEIVPHVADVPEPMVREQLARIGVAVGEQAGPEIPGVARGLVLVGPHDLRDELVADDPLRVDDVGHRECVVTLERAALVVPLHELGVLLVLRDVEELRRGLLGLAARQEREHGVDFEVLAEPVIVLDQLIIVVARDRGLDLHAEVLVALLDLAEGLVRRDRLVEEPGEDAEIVVVLADAVERHVDVQVEFGAALEDVLDDRHGPRRHAAVGRDADVRHPRVLVEDLDDLADVLAEERLPSGGQQEHQAALAHAGGDLVDLLEGELLLRQRQRGLLPVRMRPSARRQCLHFALQMSLMKYTR